MDLREDHVLVRKIEDFMLKRAHFPIEMAVELDPWTNFLFCSKDVPWTEEEAVNQIKNSGSWDKLIATGGLMKVYVEKAISENRNISIIEVALLNRSLSEAIDLMIKEGPKEEILKSLKSLSVVSKLFFSFLLEIAFEIYK